MQAWQFECVIPGAPIGKGRPRAAKMGSHVRLYTPKRTADWERSSALIMRNEWRSAPLDKICRVNIVAVFPRPKRLLRKKDPEHRLWHSSKPDIDNVCKSVFCCQRSLCMHRRLRVLVLRLGCHLLTAMIHHSRLSLLSVSLMKCGD